MDEKDRKTDRPATGSKPDAGKDQGRDKTLTEKSEEGAGGTNKKTPGPIYDV